MSLANMLEIALIGGFAGLLLWAAVSDFRSYLIPNSACLAIAALYPVYLAFSTQPVNWLGGAIVGAAVFAVGVGLFALKLTGGGDVKLLAATALWAGTERVLGLLLVMALAGGVLALVIWLARGGARYAAGGVEDVPLGRMRLPYGIAIASGGWFVAAHLWLRV